MAEDRRSAEAVAELVHDGDSVATRGLHAPDPVRRRPRAAAPGAPRARADPDDAGPPLRPDDRHGRRAAAGLLLRRQPGRRLAAPLPRRDRERLAATRSRSRSTATPGWPTATRPAPPSCRSRSCAATPAPTSSRHTQRRASSTARSPASGSPRSPALRPRRRDRPRPGGRPRRQRPAVGDPRRAEGGGARRAALAGHRRADRRARSSRAPGGVVIPGWAIDVVAEAPGGSQPSYSHGHDRARQRLLPRLGRDQPRPRRASAPGWRSTCSSGVSGGEPRARPAPDEIQTIVAARAAGATRARCSSASGARAPRRSSRGWSTTPTLVLIYESGTIGAKPFHIPLSIGDGELAETADAVVSVPGDVQLLDRRRADRRRLPRRRADRPLRQPQLDRDRRLRPSAARACRAPAARPRSPPSCGEVIVIAPHSHAHVRRAARLRHDRRLRRRPGRARAARAARPRADRGDHRPRRARARPADQRADADRRSTRASSVDAGRARRPAGSSRSPTSCATTEPPTDEELAALRELLAR